MSIIDTYVHSDNTEYEIADSATRTRVSAVEGKIPSGASSSNKMATASDITTVTNGVIANTKLIKDTVGWSGKNKWNTQNMTGTGNVGITWTKNSDKSITLNGTTTGESLYPSHEGTIGLDFYDIEGGKTYKFTTKTVNSDIELQVFCKETSGSSWSRLAQDATSGNDLVFTTPSSFYDIWIRILVRSGKTLNNVTIYPMLYDASILDDTYEPYHENVVNVLREAEVIEGKNLLENTLPSQIYHNTTITVNSDKSVSFANTPNNDLWMTINADVRLSAGKYTLNGCPSGGGENKYFLRFVVRNADDSGNAKTYFDYGSGVTFEITSTTAGRKCNVFIYVKSGQTTGFTFKPMLRLATETDPTYEPYYIPLKDSMFPRSEQAVLGAKNIFQNKAITATTNGVTYTINADGTVTANGTATADTNFWLDNYFMPPNGDYILSYGDVSNYPNTNGTLFFMNDDTWVKSVSLNGEDNKEFTVDYDGYTRIRVNFFVKNGAVLNNFKIYPMIRLASDPDDTYVPYAMTNRELTDKVNVIDISSDITINTEQTAYDITSLRVQRIGQIVVVTGSITSLTEDAVPQGRSFVSIASLLPKPIIDTHAVILSRGSGNQTELYIVANNSQLQMRGGTVNQAYQFTFTYITAS